MEAYLSSVKQEKGEKGFGGWRGWGLVAEGLGAGGGHRGMEDKKRRKRVMYVGRDV